LYGLKKKYIEVVGLISALETTTEES